MTNLAQDAIAELKKSKKLKDLKTVALDFPMEVAKRAIVPGYADRKVFGKKRK